MPTKPNPYYARNFANPYMAQINDTLASLFSQRGADVPSRILENEAQARQADALAGKYGAETAGIRAKGDAMSTPPMALADLFMSGGKLQDDPMRRNPAYQDPGPTDFSLTARPMAEPQPMMLPGVSAREKIASAIQEALIRGVKIDDIAKFAGQGGYLGQVNAGTPEAGMPYMPLFGQMPNQNTALTTGRQDAMSARDAAEALTQAESVARIQGTNQARVANINQAGANQRNAANIASREKIAELRIENGQIKGGSATKPPTVPGLSGALAKSLRGQLESFINTQGLQVEPKALDVIFTEAARMYQDPNSDAFKNPVVAASNVLEMLQSGGVGGVSAQTEQPSMLRELFTLGMAQPKTTYKAAPAAPAPAAAPAAPTGPRRPSAEAIDYLRKNPQLRDQFDAKFGAGEAAKYLK